MPEATDRRELHRPALIDGVGVVSGQADRFEQLDEFTRGQISPRTRRNAPHPQWAKPHPPEVDHGNTDSVHHLPNDMIEAFMQHDLDDDAFAGLPHQASFVRNDLTLLDHDAISEPGQLEVSRPAIGDDVILLRELVARVHHAIGDVAMVGQQQQPLRLAVQTTDRIDPLGNIDEIHHGPALPLVLDGRNEPAGLVEHDEAWALTTQDLAIDPNLVDRGVDLGPHLGDHAAVDRDPTGTDHRLGRPTAGDSPGRQHTLEPFAGVGFAGLCL